MCLGELEGPSNKPPLTPEWRGRGSWLYIFYFNVFFACVSFSIIMPSLWLYLQDMGADKKFLAWVVANYSIGEAIGAVIFGWCVNRWSYRFCQVSCIALGVGGSAMYCLAAAPKSIWLVFWGRFIQGLWTGGQQTVEQCFLSDAIDDNERTEITATLGSFAVMGFVTGPAFGALLSSVRLDLGFMQIDGNSAPAFFVTIIASAMLLVTFLTFSPSYEDGSSCTLSSAALSTIKGKHNSRSTELTPLSHSSTPRDRRGSADSRQSSISSRLEPPNTVGIVLCLLLFFVHFYNFAVQETIGTPLVQELFGWGPCIHPEDCDYESSHNYINYLFTGCGILSLITSIVNKYLSRVLSDQSQLLFSVLTGSTGCLCLIDLGGPIGILRFLLGWSLITIAFPFGRNVILSMYSQIIGPYPQGTYMSAMFAVGAVPRAIGPFIAVWSMNFPSSETNVKWDGGGGIVYQGKAPRTWMAFGITLVMFMCSLLILYPYLETVQPHPEILKLREKVEKDKKRKGSWWDSFTRVDIPSPGRRLSLSSDPFHSYGMPTADKIKIGHIREEGDEEYSYHLEQQQPGVKRVGSYDDRGRYGSI